MRRFLFQILLFCFPLLANSQAIYNGQVQDVANRTAISGVTIELLHSSVVTKTNTYGHFLIKNEERDSVTDPVNIYRFYNNAMIWDGDQEIALEIFAADGKRVDSQPKLGASGHYLFPNFPMGIYFLRVSAQNEVQSFKAFSDGNMTRVTDSGSVWHRSSVLQKPDTLQISKAGYYPRLIPLLGKDTFLTIDLLKKENDDLHYFNTLIDPVAFEVISNLPSRTHDGQVTSVKIIDNRKDGLLYYMNTKRYEYHYTFAQAQLGFNQGNGVFNQTQYRENDDRYLYPANLNYYKSLDKYVIYLVSANEMSCENILLLYEKLIATSYLEGKLYLYANRPEFHECDVPLITPEELYAGQNYQALNLAENYGYLQKVTLDELEETYLGRRNIVLLDGIPNDVSVVAGIITTEFQTPLSHINVLSHNRNTPNMALRDGWDNPLLQKHLGELVYLKVNSDSFEIRTAHLAEAEAFWAQHEPQEIIELSKNTTVSGLINLYEADYSDVDIIGGKASNFAEMLNVSVDGVPIPTPETAFAIPFYYYEKHMQDAGLTAFVNDMLENPEFKNNPAVRKAILNQLRNLIKDHPLDETLVNLVKNRINNFQEFPAFRFRSSTNAEDLEDFSGAGLYSSYSAKKDDSNKTIEQAIKKVWASLWNWRAFEERDYYNIVHTSCAMGILVHRSFPNEDANGVLITKNLYNSNPGFIINVQYKDHSIVFPEAGVLNDQIMLLTWSVVPGEEFMVEYLTFSNIPELNGETVMTDAELMELGRYAKALKQHFYENVPHDCLCTQEDFGLDIEFKVDSTVSGRKVYVKQARYYK